MPQLRFHRLAAIELVEATEWYAERSSSAKGRFLEELDVTIARILQAPASFASARQSYRYARVPGFPYVLFFQVVENDSVVVLAVAHTSRRPNYWSRRRA